MTAVRNSGSDKPRRPPATSPEARENQLISLAVDLAEQQMIKGTAPATVVVHYLKLATTKESLERKKLEAENELLKARVASIESDGESARMYQNALKAFRGYSGQDVEEEDPDA
jgi:hypothetical protein